MVDYKAAHGRPYIAEMLASEFLYRPEFSKDDMDTVDEWVTFELARRGLTPTKASYREIVDDLRGKMKLSKNSAPDQLTKKLATLLKEALVAQRQYSKLGLDLQSLEEIYGK